MHPDKGDQFSPLEQSWLNGIPLADTPEGQRFSGVYHVETREPPEGSFIPTQEVLGPHDFNAVFTGNPALCTNENIRELAGKGRCFSAEVLSDTLFFLSVSERGRRLKVYFYPVLPVDAGKESTNQDVARASRLRNMSKDSGIAAATPLPPQVLSEISSHKEDPVRERKSVRRQKRKVSRATHADVRPDHRPGDRFTAGVLLFSTAVTVTGLLYRFRGEIASLLAGYSSRSDAGSQTSPKSTSSTESAEMSRSVKPMEVVLESSRRSFLPDSKTWRDNILRRDAVTHNFLGDKFRYMDKEEGEYKGVKQTLYHFAVIGEKSGQVDAKKGSDKQYLSTSLSDAVNILLESGVVSQDDVKQWIIWMYQRSFGVVLEPRRLQLRWKVANKLDGVFYSAGPGFKNISGIEVVEKMDAGEDQPGGNVSKKREPQNVLGQGNSLLLPTGISPQHDVVVPQSLMRANPEFTLKSANGWEWSGVTAQVLSERIKAFEERVKSGGDRKAVGVAFGRPVGIEYIAPLVDRNDPLIQRLSESILKNIPAQNHQARITAIYRFVQSLPFKTEYDTDVDRPSFITLFNGGGDCNNLTILFNELMLAAGYDTAILWVAFDKNHYVGHTRGGIPEKYFPGSRSWTMGPDKWVPIELAGKQFFSPGMEAFGADETTFYIEELRR